MIAEGDTVVFRWCLAGTHSSDIPTPFGAAKASGKRVAHRGFSLHHLKDGMIIDDLFGSNIMDYWAQLGVLPK
jgi:predicted ester cyclase